MWSQKSRRTSNMESGNNNGVEGKTNLENFFKEFRRKKLKRMNKLSNEFEIFLI